MVVPSAALEAHEEGLKAHSTCSQSLDAVCEAVTSNMVPGSEWELRTRETKQGDFNLAFSILVWSLLVFVFMSMSAGVFVFTIVFMFAFVPLFMCIFIIVFVFTSVTTRHATLQRRRSELARRA